MARTADFIIKRRSSDGGYSNRFGSGMKWGRWIKIETIKNLGDGSKATAIEAADRIADRGGLYQVAVFFRGEKIYKRGD